MNFAFMTIQQAEAQLSSQLARVYDHAEATAIANLVMEQLTGLGRSQRRMQHVVELSAEKEASLEEMTSQLLQMRPVQYVIGTAWFYNMPFVVNESVLIPRPETEELVQWILEERDSRKKASILDIGTGSGCIPIALKKNWPEAEVHALDVSNEALEIAKANAKALDAEVHFQKANILEEKEWPQQQFDIIVSNPPYIPVQESNMLDKNVTDWEPHLALFVPDNDPLLFYRKIAAFAQSQLQPGGSLYFECHQQFAGEVLTMLKKEGFAATLKRDLFGNERMVRASANQH
jgi:release factor glutamine methyltransferase